MLVQQWFADVPLVYLDRLVTMVVVFIGLGKDYELHEGPLIVKHRHIGPDRDARIASESATVGRVKFSKCLKLENEGS